MQTMQEVEGIVNSLRDTAVLDSAVKVKDQMKGTTAGLVYTLTVNDSSMTKC